MEKYQLIEETLGYVTAADETNTDERTLVSGSYNVLIDRQRKVKSRAGYTRFGAANSAMTPNRNAWRWNTSTGTELGQKFYNDELDAWLGTIDGTVINAWTKVANGWSTTNKLRAATVFDTGENIDLQIMVQGDDNLYEWNGAVAVVASVTAVTITKAGTNTFAQSRFYTTRNKTVVCVRTGTEYVYTGGETTLTLTGIADTTGLIAGDILVQKIVTTTDAVATNRINSTIYSFQNQIYLGSDDDEEVPISKNTDYNDFSYSTPRLTGEGGLLTLTDPVQGFGDLGDTIVIFAGRSTAFTAEYKQITVGTTLAETLGVKKLPIGTDQAAQSQECIAKVGDTLVYLSFEPALRIITDPKTLTGIDPKAYSNPIRPDFDAEDFTDAFILWFKNAVHLTAPAGGRMYILEFVEDADGSARRFWQAPQVLPFGPLSIIDDALIGHSNAVPESYLAFSGTSDGEYTDIDPLEKIPVHARAAFAYRVFKSRANLKTFDEYYVEGEILENTKVMLKLQYDFGGATQVVEEIIDGSDTDITYLNEGLSSLGQSSLGTQPLGGSSVEPSNTLKYRVIFEMPKEDFHELQEIYETEDVDTYFSILSRGPNAKISPRRDTIIRK